MSKQIQTKKDGESIFTLNPIKVENIFKQGCLNTLPQRKQKKAEKTK